MVIINAEKINFTGNKLEDKIYYRTTTRPGSMKRVAAQTMLDKHPTRVLEEAVCGMLPHTTLGRAQRVRCTSTLATSTRTPRKSRNRWKPPRWASAEEWRIWNAEC